MLQPAQIARQAEVQVTEFEGHCHAFNSGDRLQRLGRHGGSGKPEWTAGDRKLNASFPMAGSMKVERMRELTRVSRVGFYSSANSIFEPEPDAPAPDVSACKNAEGTISTSEEGTGAVR